MKIIIMKSCDVFWGDVCGAARRGAAQGIL